MSALGQKRTYAVLKGIPLYPQKRTLEPVRQISGAALKPLRATDGSEGPNGKAAVEMPTVSRDHWLCRQK